ncbi:hypothetical protein WJX73_005886 [Symbiochloris irregularis]|uniref:Uncharacterized protein n=1 Tax=Symbiochloris irregularis TaxID=706552 RepID=A0AAW1NVZ3_9CHLO
MAGRPVVTVQVGETPNPREAKEEILIRSRPKHQTFVNAMGNLPYRDRKWWKLLDNPPEEDRKRGLVDTWSVPRGVYDSILQTFQDTMTLQISEREDFPFKGASAAGPGTNIDQKSQMTIMAYFQPKPKKRASHVDALCGDKQKKIKE